MTKLVFQVKPLLHIQSVHSDMSAQFLRLAFYAEVAESMQSAIGFVDPTFHFSTPHWKRKDWENSEAGMRGCSESGWALDEEFNRAVRTSSKFVPL